MAQSCLLPSGVSISLYWIHFNLAWVQDTFRYIYKYHQNGSNLKPSKNLRDFSSNPTQTDKQTFVEYVF